MARLRLSSGSERLDGLSFLGLGEAVEERLLHEIGTLTTGLYVEAQANLSGEVLWSRTGRLLRGLKTKIIHRKGIRITGVVVAGGRAHHYGRFWERGHTRHGPLPGPSDKVKAKRPFLKPVIDGERGRVRARLGAVVKAAARSV